MKFMSLNKKKVGLAILMISTFGAASFATPARADFIQGLAAGVQAAAEVVKVYTQLNPPQTGRVRVINNLTQEVTVRSYNNNDWAKIIAAGQLNLKPGQQGSITAASPESLVLLWKRGRYGNLAAFGPDNLGQDLVKKDNNAVFVIGDGNTP